MPFTLIMGTFRPDVGVPDGDSVRFQPDDPALMRSMPRVRMPLNATTVQLRYEGIDALEKHAIAPHAMNARDVNLALLRRDMPEGDAGPARGYILTRGGDMKSGRPISFVFTGEPDRPDGSSVSLSAEGVRKSVNYAMIEGGMAYPLFYETLFKELRDELANVWNAVINANPRPGYMGLDESQNGVRYRGPDRLGDLAPIFPKLFRRLDEWNGQTLVGFLPWLDANDNERLVTLSDGRFIGFQDVLDVNGDVITMLYDPADMVFRPKPFGPPTQ